MPGAKPGQRERLTAAAATVTARYGYGGASVARIVAQAGVSRATFYEQFADRDECVLAAYREAAAKIEPWLSQPHDAAIDPGALRGVLADLLAAAAGDPAAARLLLLESLAAGPRVRAEHERLLDRVEAWIEACLDRASARGSSFEIPARAALGGAMGVVAVRVFRSETGRLDDLVEGLAAWLESYRVSSSSGGRKSAGEWAELGAPFRGDDLDSLEPEPSSTRLPRGRSALPLGLVEAEQRERILAAVARLSREKGYLAMSVADIVTTAKISRAGFYGLFRSKEDAFLAAQAFGLEQSVALTAGRFFTEERWPDRVWNGFEAVLEYVRGQRDLAFVDLVESFTAGPASIRRSFESRMAYTLFLEDGYRERPEAEGLPHLCSEAIAGAIHELMRQRVTRGRTERMLEILPQAVYVTLAPFIGSPAALDLIEAKLAGLRRAEGALNR